MIADAVGLESVGDLAFPVILSGPVEAPVTMTYASADGTAVAGDDYIHDDDGPPFLSVHGSEGPENGFLDFVVTLSPASGVTASVDYLTDQEFAQQDPPPTASRMPDPTT